MKEITKQHMIAACRHFMRPIASMLIRSGITAKEFAEIAQASFVEAAAREYGLQGREANTARIGILTGLSRKQVARIRGLLAAETVVARSEVSSAARVLAGWHQDPDFLDAGGKPRVLAVSGANPSFEELHRRYGGDMPMTAMRKELEHAGALELLADEQVRALKRYYMPVQLDPLSVERTGSVLHDLAATVTHNLFREDKDSIFEGRASNPRIAVKHLPEFRALIEQEGEKFLYAIDDWLSEHELPPDKAGARITRAGVGVYQIVDPVVRGKKK